MKKVVFFGDSGSFITSILFDELLKYDKKLFEIVAIVDTNSTDSKKNIFKFLAINTIKKIFNPSLKVEFSSYKSFLSKAKNYKVFSPKNINDIDFLEELKKIKPDYAFSFGNPQIMKKELIETFEKIINYHNSFLPKYRGLNATAWGMTFEEKNTGYTFHEINEKIDDGKIYIQEKFEINYFKTAYELEIIKTKKARKQIQELIKLLNSKFEGTTQVGKPSYYGNKEKEELLIFEKFEDIEKIQKLIKIWSGINLKVANKLFFITSIDVNGNIKRIKWLPVNIYNLLFRIKVLLGKVK